MLKKKKSPLPCRNVSEIIIHIHSVAPEMPPVQQIKHNQQTCLCGTWLVHLESLLMLSTINTHLHPYCFYCYMLPLNWEVVSLIIITVFQPKQTVTLTQDIFWFLYCISETTFVSFCLCRHTCMYITQEHG